RRTAEREAKLILLEHTLRLTCAIAEELIGVECVVSEELEHGTMKFVATRSGHHVDDRAGVAPIGRIIDAGLHFEFLNGVGIRDCHTSAEEAARLQVVDWQSVHKEVVVTSE